MNPFSVPFLLFAAIPALVILALVRYAAARALGMKGVTRFFGGAITNPEADVVWRRALVVVAGVAASYFVAATFFAVAFLAAGKEKRSTEIAVLDGRPAARAGMATGDRVRSVGGRRVETWDELASAVAGHGGEPIEIVVARGDHEERFTVTPEGPRSGGRIGVAAMGEATHESVGVGEALGQGIVAPVERFWLLVRPGPRPEMMGPVAIVRESRRAETNGLAVILGMFAAIFTYAWPIVIITAIVTVPRRARKQS